MLEPVAPAALAGRCAVGLDVWLGEHDGLPESLVAAARSLAELVDAAPQNSALWSRYQVALDALSEAVAEVELEAQAWAEEWRDGMAVVDEAEARRAARYAAAVAAGDLVQARRWEQLVPASCARGDHDIVAYPAGVRRCVDCDLEC